MAKKVVATLKKSDSRVYTKVVRMSKSPKTGSYSFDERIMPKDLVNEFLKK